MTGEILVWWVEADDGRTAFESVQEARDYAETKVWEYFEAGIGESRYLEIYSERISLEEWNELPERAYGN